MLQAPPKLPKWQQTPLNFAAGLCALAHRAISALVWGNWAERQREERMQKLLDALLSDIQAASKHRSDR